MRCCAAGSAAASDACPFLSHAGARRHSYRSDLAIRGGLLPTRRPMSLQFVASFAAPSASGKAGKMGKSGAVNERDFSPIG